MLTIIGTGHVFNIADTVSFVIVHSWPQAVCVELDDLRYHALMGDKEAVKKDLEARGISSDGSPDDRLKGAPPIYKQSAKYQQKMSAENKSTAGADMAAAAGAGKNIGAEVVCIDRDAAAVMTKMWNEMSRGERLRYRLSGISDGIFGKRKVDKTQKDYSRNEAEYVENMRKKYPTLVRVLIDERNQYMADRIKDVCSKHERVVVVVGDGHVDGLLKLLPNMDPRVIRLKDIMDPARQKEIRQMVWDDVQ